MFVGRSSILSHVNATIQGLSTVRACNASDILQKEFHEFQDHNTSCDFLFNCASTWFAVSLDIVCLLFIATVTYSFLLLEDSKLVDILKKVSMNRNVFHVFPSTVLGANSGQVGLAIMSSINLIGICEYGIRESTELENQMVSVERIVEYGKVESEPPLESNDKNAPPKGWPTNGNIEFKALSMRYSDASAQILHHLTFRIDAKVRNSCQFSVNIE